MLTGLLSQTISAPSQVPRLPQCYFEVPLVSSTFSFFLKDIVEDVIQNLDSPALGPSLRNSCPSLLPHWLQDTLKAVAVSCSLVTLSGLTVFVNAGQADGWLNFLVLRNNSFPQFEQTYTPDGSNHKIICIILLWWSNQGYRNLRRHRRLIMAYERTLRSFIIIMN